MWAYIHTRTNTLVTLYDACKLAHARRVFGETRLGILVPLQPKYWLPPPTTNSATDFGEAVKALTVLAKVCGSTLSRAVFKHPQACAQVPGVLREGDSSRVAAGPRTTSHWPWLEGRGGVPESAPIFCYCSTLHTYHLHCGIQVHRGMELHRRCRAQDHHQHNNNGGKSDPSSATRL